MRSERADVRFCAPSTTSPVHGIQRAAQTSTCPSSTPLPYAMHSGPPPRRTSQPPHPHISERSCHVRAAAVRGADADLPARVARAETTPWRYAPIAFHNPPPFPTGRPELIQEPSVAGHHLWVPAPRVPYPAHQPYRHLVASVVILHHRMSGTTTRPRELASGGDNNNGIFQTLRPVLFTTDVDVH